MDTNDFFSALTSPCRREILRLLCGGELSAGEIAEHFDISQPAVSKHLDNLKRAGLICSRRKANQIIYSLSADARREGEAIIKEIFDK